jgi:quercetin dioxygenase-like cupin family protein
MNESTRLRAHPHERFAATEHVFNVQEALTKLRAESRPTQHGHRQITLFHQTPVTIVLFDFEAGGELREHQANGLVCIQCFEGHITVATPEHSHDLAGGTMVLLRPNVRHSVRTEEASAMLLTVHLEDKKGSESLQQGSQQG